MSPLLPLLTVLLASAQAEICYFHGKANNQFEFYELGGPACRAGNRLVFERRYDASRYSENIETLITDSWPGWGGADEKCRAAVKGARVFLDKPGAVIIGKANMGRPQVWAYTKGGCSTFRYRLADAVKGKTKDTKFEDVFEELGAGKEGGVVDDGLTILLEKMIELGSAKK